LSSLSVEVPDTFTWTVRSQTVDLIGYGPATVGSYGPAWYSGPVRNENEKVIGIWWYKGNPYGGGLEARISARKQLPHPDWSEQIVSQILEGVINDGGGLVLVGGHLVRVPHANPSRRSLPPYRHNSRSGSGLCSPHGRRANCRSWPCGSD
jgi:hypothetical protein